MSTILLADESPHARRMGERILTEEGFRVVLAGDGKTALRRLGDCDPDVVIADMFLPGHSGFDLCAAIKANHRHVRVILTAGLLETIDAARVRQSGCDAILNTPFEATLVTEAVKKLADEARRARNTAPVISLTADQLRDHLNKAIAAELPRFIEEIVQKVLTELGQTQESQTETSSSQSDPIQANPIQANPAQTNRASNEAGARATNGPPGKHMQTIYKL